MTIVPVLLIAGGVLAVFWDVHHSAMQTFGLSRIYDMKAGNGALELRRTDLRLNWALYVGPIAAGASLAAHLASFGDFGRIGWTGLMTLPSLAESHVLGIRETAIAVWLAIVAWAAFDYRAAIARGYRLPAHKAALVGSAAIVSIAAWGFATPVIAFAIINLFHAVQYFALSGSRKADGCATARRSSPAAAPAPGSPRRCSCCSASVSASPINMARTCAGSPVRSSPAPCSISDTTASSGRCARSKSDRRPPRASRFACSERGQLPLGCSRTRAGSKTVVLDFLKKQFIDVIEWTDEPGVIAIKLPFRDNEIQNGAVLTVRESQMAAFVNEGRVADVFGPGRYTLETATLPLLTNLMNWDKAFASPFKSDVYFFSLREQINLKWGTTQPVTIRDKELGPIRLRAFGTYSFRIEDVAPFSVKLMGTLERVRCEDLEPQLRAAIATALATGLGTSDVPFLDLAGNQTLMSEKLKEAVTPALAQWGLAVTSFFVESVSLPEEVQKYLDKAGSMRVIGDLDRYAKFQSAEAIEAAAANPGGLAGLGAGAAAGMAIGQTMAAGLAGAGSSGGGGGAAPAEDAFALVEKLHKLLTMGAISQEEFDTKKAELLGRIR